jgi:hypothetical protein
MKKEYLIGLLTGCLLTASALMFMGAIDNDSQIGKYQISNIETAKTPLTMIDTRTGQRYNWGLIMHRWKKEGSPLED